MSDPAQKQAELANIFGTHLGEAEGCAVAEAIAGLWHALHQENAKPLGVKEAEKKTPETEPETSGKGKK